MPGHTLALRAESVEVDGGGGGLGGRGGVGAVPAACVGSQPLDVRFYAYQRLFLAAVPAPPLPTSHRARERVFVLPVSPLLTRSCQHC